MPEPSIPFQNRLGVWSLITPSGETLVEKERYTESWEINAVDFSLSEFAPTGDWTLKFVSGDYSQSQTVTVEPFTLPASQSRAHRMHNFTDRGST